MFQEQESQCVIRAYSNTAWEERISEMKGLGIFICLWNKHKITVPESERRLAFFNEPVKDLLWTLTVLNNALHFHYISSSFKYPV